MAAPVAIIAVVWVLWRWKELRDDANATSAFKIGPIWFACLGVITPIALAVILFFNVRDLLAAGPRQPAPRTTTSTRRSAGPSRAARSRSP